MKKIFLTSSMELCYKKGEIWIPKKMNNQNKIITQIEENLIKEDLFLFICSSPDNYEKNDSYSRMTFESFKMSGFNFRKNIVVDHRYSGNLKEDIEKADLVFLSGGHTPTEMAYFNEINLKELLKEYKGVIIGQSAGSINLAKKVLCAPEYDEEIGTSYTWDGLGLTDINIEPHFVLDVEEKDKKIREELLKLSINNKIYAICDGSHIFDDGENVTLYGEGYLIQNKEIKKICEVRKALKLKR